MCLHLLSAGALSFPLRSSRCAGPGVLLSLKLVKKRAGLVRAYMYDNVRLTAVRDPCMLQARGVGRGTWRPGAASGERRRHMYDNVRLV